MIKSKAIKYFLFKTKIFNYILILIINNNTIKL